MTIAPRMSPQDPGAQPKIVARLRRWASTVNPFRVIGPAVKAVPAVRYAVGVAGIMAALALGAAFFKDVASAVIGTVAMIILMVLLRVFAAMAATPNHQLKWPAIVLTWTVMVLFILGAGTIFSSVVFGKPRPLSELISGGGGRIDHTYSNTTVTGDQLPGSVKE